MLGQDGRYAISTNAGRARQYGLAWMVSTDHGGPNHSKLNRDLAYPALLESRTSIPEVIQFYGMEFDTPSADHSSLIIPHSSGERDALYDIESRFAKRDKFPRDSTWDTEPRMVEALKYMASKELPPLAHRESSRHVRRPGCRSTARTRRRSFATGTTRRRASRSAWKARPDTRPGALNRDGSLDTTGARGSYSRYATMGGFDQMTARVGGLWDALLGEGRRWWITSTSDSHRNWRDGGSDFWPGEYSKTYVHANRSHADILDGIRNGRVFVTIGDLVSELWVYCRRGSGSCDSHSLREHARRAAQRRNVPGDDSRARSAPSQQSR